MMNVYDYAHNLANSLKESPEYKEYINAKKIVDSNPDDKAMFENFKEKAMEIQMAQMTGQEIEEEKMNNIKSLEEVVMNNSSLSDLFSSEMKFNQIMNDIYKILNDKLNIE